MRWESHLKSLVVTLWTTNQDLFNTISKGSRPGCGLHCCQIALQQRGRLLKSGVHS